MRQRGEWSKRKVGSGSGYLGCGGNTLKDPGPATHELLRWANCNKSSVEKTQEIILGKPRRTCVAHTRRRTLGCDPLAEGERFSYLKL